jgi:hypothetical protein
MHLFHLRTPIAVAVGLIAATSFAQSSALTEEQVNDGWIALFDGQSLYGWEKTGDANWSVEDGAIRATSGEECFLMSTTQWADYQLHVEFRAPETTNSGVFLRTPTQPKDPASDCYELNIAPADNPFPTGSLVGRRLVPLEGAQREVWNGQWHAFDVVCMGGVIAVSLDGQSLGSYNDEHPVRRGRIGLQFREGEIAFRNVRLKPLGLEAIFNGKDLVGWNAERAEASEFTVNDQGELQVTNGRGQLESDGKYGDFVLQLECFVNGDALNSGMFFRCIPGDFQMGYECQIHNGVVDGDPTKPVDCGTGGFYRRQDARQVRSNDREWFALTLAADGPHMAAWVNGVQVSDWTDHREPDENPRRGLRTEPGTLAIQGHDPTTDLRFRNLRAGESPR